MMHLLPTERTGIRSQEIPLLKILFNGDIKRLQEIDVTINRARLLAELIGNLSDGVSAVRQDREQVQQPEHFSLSDEDMVQCLHIDLECAVFPLSVAPGLAEEGVSGDSWTKFD